MADSMINDANPRERIWTGLLTSPGSGGIGLVRYPSGWRGMRTEKAPSGFARCKTGTGPRALLRSAAKSNNGRRLDEAHSTQCIAPGDDLKIIQHGLAWPADQESVSRRETPQAALGAARRDVLAGGMGCGVPR